MKMKKQRKGFTLTELAIVIAVIAILIAVLVPTFVSLINKAGESADEQMIYNVNNALSIENASNSIDTPEEALNVAADAGYNIEAFSPYSDGNVIIYDEKSVSFALVTEEGELVYGKSGVDYDMDAPTTWYIVDEATYNSYNTTADSNNYQVAKTSIKSATAGIVNGEGHTVSYILKGDWSSKFEYTGMGGIYTKKANGITNISYTIKTVTNTKNYMLNMAYGVSKEVETVAVEIADTTANATYTIQKSCGTNTVTTVTASVAVSVTFEAEEEDTSPVLYEVNSNIEVTVTQNGTKVEDVVTVVTDITAAVDRSDSGVPQLGTKNYPYLVSSDTELQARLDEAVNSTTKYIKLTSSINGGITVNANSTIILDLNDKTIKNADKDSTIINNGTLTINGEGTVDCKVADNAAAILNNGTLTLNGGEYTRSKDFEGSDTYSYYVILNHGTATINEGVSVYSDGTKSSLVSNGWYTPSDNTAGTDCVMTINGGTFTGGLNTVKNDDYGVMTINGGTFTNKISTNGTGVIMNWNILTINGGTITNTYSVNRSIYYQYRYAICCCYDTDTYSTKYENSLTTINGGTISNSFSTAAKYWLCVNEGATVNISGGIFSNYAATQIASSYLIDSYSLYYIDGAYGVISESEISQNTDYGKVYGYNIYRPISDYLYYVEVDGVKTYFVLYTDLTNAYSTNAAKQLLEGKTLVFLKDYTTSIGFVYNVIVDLNGHTLNVSFSTAQAATIDTLTIIDSVGGGKISNTITVSSGKTLKVATGVDVTVSSTATATPSVDGYTIYT